MCQPACWRACVCRHEQNLFEVPASSQQIVHSTDASRHDILKRMAALHEIDLETPNEERQKVDAIFPEWRQTMHLRRWNTDVVIGDLLSSVAALAAHFPNATEHSENR